jgi:hypothetical protein
MMTGLPLAISIMILIVQSAFLVFLRGALLSVSPGLCSIRSARLRI